VVILKEMVEWDEWDDEWAESATFNNHRMRLGSVNSRKAMQISKEALHVNLIRIIYFLKEKEFDEGNRYSFLLIANFDNNSNEKSIRIIVRYRGTYLANEEKVWLDRSDMVRKKVQEVFGEDWGVPNLEPRPDVIITDVQS